LSVFIYLFIICLRLTQGRYRTDYRLQTTRCSPQSWSCLVRLGRQLTLTELLLVRATYSSITAQSKNNKHFQWPVVCECTGRIFSEWVPAAFNSPLNLVHAREEIKKVKIQIQNRAEWLTGWSINSGNNEHGWMFSWQNRFLLIQCSVQPQRK
jgi:hypothetical protein